jgi:hypothetical protein
MDRNHIVGHNEWQNAAWTSWMSTNWPQIDTTCNDHTDPGKYWNWTHFMQLILNGAPSITAQPLSVYVTNGVNVTLKVTATGTPAPGYQWYFNSAKISGATATTYTVNNVQPANAGGYKVVVTNTIGTNTSDAAFICVQPPLTNYPSARVSPAGMVDWWPGEGNANDIFGYYNAATRYGVSYVAGKIGQAFHFDGSTSYVDLELPEVAPPWTASFWVNRQNAPGASAALMSDASYSLKLEQYNGTRKVGVTVFGVQDAAFNYTAPVGTWVNLVFVGTSKGVTLYANGVSEGSITNIVSLPRRYMGVDSASTFLDYALASVDEVMIFNRALTLTEVGTLYSAGTGGLLRGPEVASATAASPGQFRLALKGQTGKNFTVQSSADLKTWVTDSIVANPLGTNLFTESISNNLAGKYFRVRQP